MYYQNYEDYMRTILGYPVPQENTYAVPNYYQVEERNYNSMSQMKNEELEMLYPNIYKEINPFVCKMCNECKEPITPEVVDKMANEIYQKIEFNHEVMIKVNVDTNSRNEISTNNSNNGNSNGSNNSRIVNNEMSKVVRTINNEPQRPKTEARNERSEDRQRRPNNSLLLDLIRILILNNIIGGGRPPRPPRPPYPPRPPFPGGPGGPGMPPPRPPYPMPRAEFGTLESSSDYEGYFKN